MHFFSSRYYPFDYLAEFTNNCKNIVIFFKDHHALHYALKQAQTEKGVQALALPAPTRWGSLKHCFTSLFNSEDILFSIINSRDFISNSPANQKEICLKLKEIITRNDLVPCLKPIDALIVEFQSDSVPVSYVYASFVNLSAKYDTSDMAMLLMNNEISFIKSLVKDRIQFIYGDARGIGYLLDPRYVGEKLDHELRMELEDFLLNFPLNDIGISRITDQKTSMYREITDYIITANEQKWQNTFSFQMLVQKKKIGFRILADGLKRMALASENCAKGILFGCIHRSFGT